MTTLGLYIHIPFCRKKCAYCDFYSLADSAQMIQDYTDALCRHLKGFGLRTAGGYQTDTVYFGGGTPSILGAEVLLKIWDTVRHAYSIAPDAEITLEANPESVGEWLSQLRQAGFNRLSLGMQSANDGELHTLGRIHTAQQVHDAVNCIRRAGFDNLSLDLMYGLPGQTAQSWRHSVETALSYAPEHLSCYGLKIEPETPFGRRTDLHLPAEDVQAEWYLETVAELERHGLRQYEISNFARAGRESRHNRKYWTLYPYAGFGPGAHSDFNGIRYAFSRNLNAYMNAVRTENIFRFPDKEKPFLCREETALSLYSERESISPAERVREWIMLGLRTTDGLCAEDFIHRFGEHSAPFPDSLITFVRQCVRAGYLYAEPGQIRMTPQGFLLSNQITGQILDLFV